MRRIEFQQGSDAWLKWRKGLLTATDAPMLLGASPYVTPYKGWQRKVGEAEEIKVNEAMLRGHRDEPIARELFIKEYGIPMEACCVESDTYNFIGASLDGISESGEYILEIKSQRPIETIPNFHMMQMQHQLLSTDYQAKKCFYVSHWQGENKTFEVFPDLEWMKSYLPKAREFWNGVVFHEPPALENKDYKDMGHMASWDYYANKYINICEKMKHLEAEKEIHRKELIKLCGSDSCCGSGIKVMKKISKGRVDYKQACDVLKIQEDVLNQYRKPTTMSWAITMD